MQKKMESLQLLKIEIEGIRSKNKKNGSRGQIFIPDNGLCVRVQCERRAAGGRIFLDRVGHGIVHAGQERYGPDRDVAAHAGGRGVLRRDGFDAGRAEGSELHLQVVQGSLVRSFIGGGFPFPPHFVSFRFFSLFLSCLLCGSTQLITSMVSYHMVCVYVCLFVCMPV